MTQIELNKKLYEECEKSNVNYNEIETLLKLGADPLGSISNNDKYHYLYNELLFENKNIYEITMLFIKHGMKIKYLDYVENDGNNINPLWILAFRCDSEGIKTLKLLLDNNLDYQSAEVLVDHIYTDYIFLNEAHEDFDEKYRKENFRMYEYAIKMILLCASYHYILDQSEYIKEIINYSNNNYDISKFCEYDDFYMEENDKELLFYENLSKDLVWKIKL